MPRSISRALLLYYLFTLVFTGGMLLCYKSWHNGGKEERKLHAALAQGHKPGWKYYVSVYGPRALLINVGLSSLLLVAGPWAARKIQLAATDDAANKLLKHKPLIAAAAVVLVASAAWTAPRLDQSLWTDEATAMLRFMVGEYVQDESGAWTLEKVPAVRRQFYMLTPNNHMLYSTLAGVCHEWLAEPMREARDYYFSEAALRLPAFVFGLVALLALGWLGWELGLGRWALFALALLALHPWHAQYMALARGYSLVMACIPAFLAAALRAVRLGCWRWWLAAALPQVIMVDTWPLAADVVIVGNACLLALLLLQRWSREERQTQLARWAVVSLVAAIAVHQLLAPALPQIAVYMQNNAHYSADFVSFFVNPALGLFSAQGWVNIEPANPYVFGWVTTLQRQPWAVLQLIVCFGLFCLGLWKLWRGSLTERCLACFILGVPVVITGHLLASHFVFLPWYGVPALPGILLTVTYGARALLSRYTWGWRWGAPALLAIFALCWAPVHLALKAVPGGCNRESAEITRKVLNPLHPDYGKESVTAFIGALYKGYDNLALPIENQADLEQCMALAEKEQKVLYVNLGRQNILYPEQIKVRHFLEQSGQFIMHGPLYGWEPEATRWVFEWKKR